MKKCTKCGRVFDDNNSYCEFCGTPLGASNEMPVKKSKKKGIIIVIIILILVACGVAGGVYYFLSNSSTEVDLTENCEVSFKGEDTTGTVSFACSPEYEEVNDEQLEFIESIQYSAKPASHLSNGDKVEIVAKFDEDEALDLKLELVNDTKEVEVSGLEEKKQEEQEEEEKNETQVSFSQIRTVSEFIDELKRQNLPISNTVIFDDKMNDELNIVGVNSKCYFEDADYAGTTPKSTAYLTGGTIEICGSEQEAQNRLNTVNSLENHEYMYNYVFGRVYIRLDKVLSLERVQEYEKVFDEMNDVNSTKAATMRETGL